MSEGDSSGSSGKRGRGERGEGRGGGYRGGRGKVGRRERVVEERKRRSSVAGKEEGCATRHRWKRDSERVGYIEL